MSIKGDKTLKFCKQECYPRTYHRDLADDVFRLYDRDGNGFIMFEVSTYYCFSNAPMENQTLHIKRYRGSSFYDRNNLVG